VERLASDLATVSVKALIRRLIVEELIKAGVLSKDMPHEHGPTPLPRVLSSAERIKAAADRAEARSAATRAKLGRSA
jgi:hypothetical protein